MRQLILTNEMWTREEIAQDIDGWCYLFGDNLDRFGNAGQACIRGLDNAFGVTTKRSPRMTPDAFFTDADHEEYAEIVAQDLAELPENVPVVFHVETGRGLAKLHERSPKCYAELLYQILRLGAE